MTLLTPAQEEAYAEQGYLLVSGLFSMEIAQAAEAADAGAEFRPTT